MDCLTGRIPIRPQQLLGITYQGTFKLPPPNHPFWKQSNSAQHALQTVRRRCDGTRPRTLPTSEKRQHMSCHATKGISFIAFNFVAVLTPAGERALSDALFQFPFLVSCAVSIQVEELENALSETEKKLQQVTEAKNATTHAVEWLQARRRVE